MMSLDSEHWVVVLVLSVIFLGLAISLIVIERRLSRLEKKFNKKKND